MDFKNEIAVLVSKAVTYDASDIADIIEIPPDAGMGDYALPCFRFSKQLRKSPNVIAGDICAALSKPDYISEIKAEGPYVNFFIDRTVYTESVINKVLSEKEGYGSSEIGNGKTILIDYSSPNVAKPFHLGHLRTTFIGHALYNIYKFLGYKTISINHLGDWGTQFGKLIVAYNKWGNKEAVEKGGVTELNRLYVKFHEEAENNPDALLDDEARSWLVKMQRGDEFALSLWRWFNEISMKDYDRAYDTLGIKFDYTIGESFYHDKVQEIVDMLKAKNLLVESDGAMIVDLEAYKMPPCLILKRDGGTLYPTHDIAAAYYRKRTFDFDKCLYVTGSEQILHFEQWGKVVELMGEEWAKDLIHIPYGVYVNEFGKLSSRKGKVILMDDLINEAVAKTRDIIEEKNPGLADKDIVAAQVGLGAVIFNDLYNNRIKDVFLSFDKILNFNGETGPYLQYTHARACSILAKAGCVGEQYAELSSADFSLITDEFSTEVIKLLDLYPEKISEAARRNEPYIVSRHLMELAKSFSKFYDVNYILQSADDVKLARLSLVYSVKLVLESGLKLLGIAAPEKM